MTDMLTGLIWLKDASCADLAGTDSTGRTDWTTALTAAQVVADVRRRLPPSWAWYVSLSCGSASHNLKVDALYVWPVRGGQ